MKATFLHVPWPVRACELAGYVCHESDPDYARHKRDRADITCAICPCSM